MMTKWTVLAAALLVPQLAPASEFVKTAPAAEASDNEVMPFVAGEKLRYEVRLLGLTAGSAELRVDDGEGGEWRLFASGRTEGATDSIFGLRQSASCTVHGDQLEPEVCLFTSRQRKGMKRREVRYDRETGEMRERRLEDGKRSEKTRNFKEEGVQEALSGLYLLRKDLPEKGETFSFRTLRKGKPIVVEAETIGEETIETEAGSFLATVVDLRIATKVDKDAAKAARVWFSADERRLPVLISVDAPVGSLKAELVAASGTRGGSLARR